MKRKGIVILPPKINFSMKAKEIRQAFLDFFESKGHKIVPSALLVSKSDPTLMFTNSGMAPFKDYFLGNKTPESTRIADTQKCLRVSGKHNDLEDVGMDGTHHTMFEMLGNWSFGDYFKEDAIKWSWELLTEVYKLPKDRLYATVFGGDDKEGLASDEEAKTIWKKYLPEDHILYGNKKDNFWEMGETGPCGPCSEIHIDLRDEKEISLKHGNQLVNQDDPKVVEIWNNVFIQFNRKADKSLEPLPAKHVDTGMGFERLCMTIQGKKYTYDTDVFTPLIQKIEELTGVKYEGSYERSAKKDIAIRVVADHIRAVAFTIADGELPSNTGAGYVIRRILRRAVRYYYSFLNTQQPLLCRLMPVLDEEFGDVFPELRAQLDFVTKVIQEEECSFLRTLESGIKRFESLEISNHQINGQDAFELYDTFGFPIDLTRLMAAEKGCTIDEAGFDAALKAQKERSRADAHKAVGDWMEVRSGFSSFQGYDDTQLYDAKVLKYRVVSLKGNEQYQLVLDKTPFYAESGGQCGDTGLLYLGDETIQVLDTKKENDLILHIVDKLPMDMDMPVQAVVFEERRQKISNNHSAVHLMHAALHEIVGKHALQKGQNVDDERLRFDFSHFQKLTDDELKSIELMVNQKIRENIPLEERRNVPIEEAKELGAMMLFGEKYGEEVRVITFDPNFSVELCGGTHVPYTGCIGQFKILSESAVAAGVRRIEALTGQAAQDYIRQELEELDEIRAILKAPKNTVKALNALQEENKKLLKEIEHLQNEQANSLKKELVHRIRQQSGINLLKTQIPLSDAKVVRNLMHQIEKEHENMVVVFGYLSNDKPQIAVAISDALVKAKNWNAGQIVKELAKDIQGSGGGQAGFAIAGGQLSVGLSSALNRVEQVLGL